MKSLFFFIAITVCVLFIPAKAQESTDNNYTVVFDESIYQVTTTIKGKQFYELKIKTDTLTNSIVINGDISLQQIRLLFDKLVYRQIDAGIKKMQQDKADNDSALSDLEIRFYALNDSLKQARFDTANKRIMIVMQSDSIRITRTISRLQKDSLSLLNQINQLKIKQLGKSHFPDSIYSAVYNNTNLFVGSFFNEKTAENWGMTNAQFAAMETMEARLQEKNDRIDDFGVKKRGLKKSYRKTKKLKIKEIKKEENRLKIQLNQLEDDSAFIEKNIEKNALELNVILNALSSPVAKDTLVKDSLTKEKLLREGRRDRMYKMRENTGLQMYTIRSSLSTNSLQLTGMQIENDLEKNSYTLQKTEVKNQRNQIGKDLQKFKRQHVQPSVYLSGSAFAYLNKSINNDSVKSNILAIGLYAEKGDIASVDMQITFGQSEDIISANNRDVFGSSILVPGIRSLSFLSNFNQNSLFPNSKDRFWRHLGLGASFNVSQVQWRWTNNDSMNINNGLAVRVVPVAIDGYMSYNWLRSRKGRINQDAKTEVYTDLGLSTRWIRGNASQSEQILKQFTGSERDFYCGVLFGCKIKVDRLTIFYHGVLFPTSWYGGVPGLTGGQIVSSLGFRADIVKFK